MAQSTKFEVYKDKKGHFRWKLLSRNGESVAEGGEGYSEKRGVMTAVKKMKEWASTTEIMDTTISAPVKKKK